MNHTIRTVTIVLFSIGCAFSQIESFIADDIYKNCDEKCYVLIKIPDIVYRETEDDSMVTAKINEESMMWLRKSIRKELSVVNRRQLDTIKNCKSSALIVDVKNFTRKEGNLGLAAGAVIVKFLYFENVNNKAPDKVIEVSGVGKALWGDLNVFSSAYRNAINQFNDINSPPKVKFRPIEKENDLFDR